MRRFPGQILRGGRNGSEVLLSEEQERWLKRWFPVTENARLAKAMGISIYAVRSHARRLGVSSKSEEGMKAINRRRGRVAARTNERNGCYERKRGHPVSEATLDGVRRRWERFHKGEGESAMAQLRRTDFERYKENMRLRSIQRKEMIHMEKLRVIYGLKRKTNLKAVVMKPFTRSQTQHRHSALNRGYLLAEDCSEGTRDRYTIFYDDETQRSKRFEENCIKDGFAIKKDE